MNKQMSLSALSDELAQVRTKKKEFLAEIERIVPWGEWITLIRPCYYKGERGNKPYDLERMLRIYLVQNLYNLSDMATVAEVIDSRAFSDFCGVESSNQVPDGDTLGRFRNLLIRNNLQEKLFAQVVGLLAQRGLILKKGTIVDSTFIESPSSTKNQKKERDPEAHSAKKGNTWHFGYKAHIGVDSKSGLVHTVKVTAANVHDVTVASDLLTGEEEVIGFCLGTHFQGHSSLPRELLVFRLIEITLYGIALNIQIPCESVRVSQSNFPHGGPVHHARGRHAPFRRNRCTMAPMSGRQWGVCFMRSGCRTSNGHGVVWARRTQHLKVSFARPE